jgi:Sulfotransferase domain
VPGATDPFLRDARVAVKRIRFRHRTLRRPLVVRRYQKLNGYDALLASYPRSGTTWLRFLLYESLLDVSTAFGEVRRGVPSVQKLEIGIPVLESGGRIVQTHEPYCDQDRRVVYVVRDPRSVVVSEFKWQRYSGFYAGSFDPFFKDFLVGRTNPWGSWGDHVAFWKKSDPARNDHLHIVRYEDLRADPEGTFAGVLSFLGVPKDPSVVAQVISNNTVERMREKEDEARARRGDSPKKELRFVNTGSVAGWATVLSPVQQEAIRDRFGDIAAGLGYDLATAPPERLAGSPSPSKGKEAGTRPS